jgi:general stress protein 26
MLVGGAAEGVIRRWNLIILPAKPGVFALSGMVDSSQNSFRCLPPPHKLCIHGSPPHRPAGPPVLRFQADQANQEDAPMTTHNAADVAKLSAKIKDLRFPMFTWQDEHGRLLSQPMTQQQVDEDGGIWFYTSTLSSLWECIARQPQVNLGFADQEHSLYVSVSGTAERVVDRERIRAMWNAAVQAWFPAGPEDQHVVLIRVDPHSAEYWDSNDSKMVRIFAMAKAAITGDKPDLDSEHETIKL